LHNHATALHVISIRRLWGRDLRNERRRYSYNRTAETAAVV